MADTSPSGTQTWIHFLEEGGGQLWVRRLLVFVLLATVGVLYHVFEARNFSSPEAMDQGQLARNLAEGRGYTTWNIRPFGLYLLRQGIWKGPTNELRQLHDPIPDLENAPVYPVLWSGLMKVLPTRYRNGRVAANQQATHRPPPEVAISFLNLALFLGTVAGVYLLARRLFDSNVAVLAALACFGAEVLWRFVYSGLSTHLLLLLVVAIAACIVSWERTVRLADAHKNRAWLWAGLIGFLLGAAALTRYSAGWLLIPTVGWVAFVPQKGRWRHVVLIAGLFLLVLSPWVLRNWQLSRTPFGTAGFAALVGTPGFPAQKLERSQNPNLSAVGGTEVMGKVLGNAVLILESDLPKLGGSWVNGFFLAGLFLPFQNVALRRFRLWVAASLLTLVLAQALGQTELSRLSPEINSENLVILLFPCVCIFGAGLVETLIGSREFPFPLAAELTRTASVLITSFPLLCIVLQASLAILGVASRRHFVVVDPPYRPSLLGLIGDWVPPGTPMMSDMPWAVAWYAEHPTWWLPLRLRDDSKEDFLAVHLHQRPIKAMLLTPVTTNAEFRDTFVANPDMPWGVFYLDLLLRGRLPDGFPLNYAERDLLGIGYCLVAERDWWNPSRP